MRRHVTTAAVLLGLLLVPSGPAPRAQPPALSALPSDAGQAKKELRERYLRARKEQASRHFIQGLSRHVPSPDLGFLKRKYNVLKDPVYRDLSDHDLGIYIHNLEIEITARALTYGHDDVKDIIYYPSGGTVTREFLLTDEQAIEASRSVAAIVSRDVLTRDDETGKWTLKVKPLVAVQSSGDNLCEFDRFHGDPFTVVLGTGFLVADDLIATAGHVAYDPHQDFLDAVYFLFDYALVSDDEAQTVYSDDEVYTGVEVVQDRNDATADWALVRLEHATGRTPLSIRSEGKVPDGTKLYMLGFPYGMPIKYAGEGEILENTPCAQFLCNLDTYPDNSGSPVLNAETNEVEGIMVSDVGSFLQYCDCLASGVYADWMGFPGATATRTTQIAGYLNHPDSFVIRCRVPAAKLLVASQEEYMGQDEEREFSFDGLGVDLQVNDQCVIRYDCQPGDTWQILETSIATPVTMEPACPE